MRSCYNELIYIEVWGPLVIPNNVISNKRDYLFLGCEVVYLVAFGEKFPAIKRDPFVVVDLQKRHSLHNGENMIFFFFQFSQITTAINVGKQIICLVSIFPDVSRQTRYFLTLIFIVCPGHHRRTQWGTRGPVLLPNLLSWPTATSHCLQGQQSGVEKRQRNVCISTRE